MIRTIKKTRPVGNTIITSNATITTNPFSPYSTYFYSSGTASLAATIIASHKLKLNIKNPEVIVPAYGCPDLISAIICAGAIPVLVDLNPESPLISLEELKNSITDQTVAIIAVRFFGISERFDKLSKIAKQNNLVLIEDSAQGFPISTLDEYWHGDFIVLSFGRGKPVNLLGGGAVLTRAPELLTSLLEINPIHETVIDKFKFKLKLLLYNLSIKPLVYGLVTRIPGLKIGQTIYKQLNNIENISDYTKSLLTANLENYRNSKNCQNGYFRMFLSLDSNKVINIPEALEHNMSQPLLRYPILIQDTTLRNKIYDALKPYGVTLMYKQPLHQMDTVKQLIKQQKYNYPNATLFSKQLLTLPTHEAIDQKTFNIITDTISTYCKE